MRPDVRAATGVTGSLGVRRRTARPPPLARPLADRAAQRGGNAAGVQRLLRTRHSSVSSERSLKKRGGMAKSGARPGRDASGLAEETRSRLVQAAVGALHEVGFAGASAREI